MKEAAQNAGATAQASAVADLYAASGAAAVGLGEGEFAAALASVAAKYLPAGANEQQRAAFYRTLRVEELALARACAAGHEKAWEIFLTRFREKLYDAARGVVGEDSRAKELADSLYAELYGLRERDGQRVSKLESYNGRGSLEGWLRAVLAQEYVNRYRGGKRLVSLEEQAEAGAQFAEKAGDAPAAADPRLEEATDEALAALAGEERYILAAYYLDGRTLAEIGRTLGAHESTISRKVEKIAKGVRKAIVEGLRRRGMSERQAAEALESDVRDLRVEVREKLAQETRGSPFSEKEEKKAADRR
jgi:RNA polymerase sigma-70 factor (ECF subfamily)